MAAAIALLTCPALAQARPMIPLVPECSQYGFTGLNVLDQSNGYRLEFNANGAPTSKPRDSDGDGIPDGEEIDALLNPFLPDTDFVGVNGGDELQNGTNPRHPFSN